MTKKGISIPVSFLCISAFAVIFSFWLMFHTFGYDPKTHEIIIASKLWSDFGAHIPLIRSFSMGNNWPPEYPLFPGEPIRYHFLFYFLVGMLEKYGVRIDWALNIPSALGMALLIIIVYALAKKLFDNIAVAVFSVVFFLFNGSLSFLRFFEKYPLSTNTIHDITANLHFPSFAPWGAGDVTAFWNLNIYTNQRHLACSFGIALLFIYTSIIFSEKFRNRKTHRKLSFILGTTFGAVIGLMPFFHQPTLLIVAVFMIFYFIFFPQARLFLAVSGIVSAMAVALQYQFFSNNPKAIEWYPGYLIHNDLTIRRFISYWWNNLGLNMIFVLIGFAIAPIKVKKAIFPVFPLFIFANMFKFSVEIAASHKFFNFFLICGNMLTAYVLVRMFQFIKARSSKLYICVFNYMLIGSLVFFLILSGIIDFFAVYNDSRGGLADIKKDETASWVLNNTPPGSLFLNSSFLYSPEMLAGRKALLGWPYFAWSAGYDTYKRLELQKQMFASKNKDDLCILLNKHRIDYILIFEPGFHSEFSINYEFFKQAFSPLYKKENGSRSVTIYPGRSSCTGI